MLVDFHRRISQSNFGLPLKFHIDFSIIRIFVGNDSLFVLSFQFIAIV